MAKSIECFLCSPRQWVHNPCSPWKCARAPGKTPRFRGLFSYPRNPRKNMRGSKVNRGKVPMGEKLTAEKLFLPARFSAGPRAFPRAKIVWTSYKSFVSAQRMVDGVLVFIVAKYIYRHTWGFGSKTRKTRLKSIRDLFMLADRAGTTVG